MRVRDVVLMSTSSLTPVIAGKKGYEAPFFSENLPGILEPSAGDTSACHWAFYDRAMLNVPPFHFTREFHSLTVSTPDQQNQTPFGQIHIVTK